MAVGGEGVMDGLDVRGVQPDCRADAGVGDGRQVGAGNEVPECKSDRGRLENDRVGRARR